MLVELSDEQLHFIVQGLLTAACMSREHGHNKQADDFGRVRQSVLVQAEAARVAASTPYRRLRQRLLNPFLAERRPSLARHASTTSIRVPSGQMYPQNPRGTKTHITSITPAHTSDQTHALAASAVERLTSGSMIKNASASMRSFAFNSSA